MQLQKKAWKIFGFAGIQTLTSSNKQQAAKITWPVRHAHVLYLASIKCRAVIRFFRGHSK